MPKFLRSLACKIKLATTSLYLQISQCLLHRKSRIYNKYSGLYIPQIGSKAFLHHVKHIFFLRIGCVMSFIRLSLKLNPRLFLGAEEVSEKKFFFKLITLGQHEKSYRNLTLNHTMSSFFNN